LLVSS
jgi:hypothetical protein